MEHKVQCDVHGLEQHQDYRPGQDVFGGMTVGDVSPHGAVFKIRPEDALSDVAEVLSDSTQTAIAVVGDDERLLGLLTVNDVLRAYFEGVPPERRLSEWLASGQARASELLLERITVHPLESLARVAERMVSNALAGDCACHHVVVREAGGCPRGVLSSHDLVALLSRHDAARHQARLSDMFAPPDAEEVVATMTVRNAMKHSGRVFTCPPTDSMRDALKVLLVTQQNSIVVVDESGIYGFVTPRDAVKAFAGGLPTSANIAEWLNERGQGAEGRMVPIDMRLLDAAAKMASEEIDHLIVVHPGGHEAVGVLSSMDILLRTSAHAPLLRTVPLWSGPTVGEVLADQRGLAEVHARDTTLGEAARVLAHTGRTSILIEMNRDGSDFGLLTESEVLRAYLDGWSKAARIEDLLASTELQHADMLRHFQVPPTMRLTEAAAMMLSAAEPSNTCHHLVVRSAAGGLLGVFSALDVARALHTLPSQLEFARAGLDETTVDMVMRDSSTVPACRPTDTIEEALRTLDLCGQHCAFVADADGAFLGVITPRCALHAFADGVPRSEQILAWLQRGRGTSAQRQVHLGSRLSEAVSIMASSGLHHLVVVEESGVPPVGVLSALDVARGVISVNTRCPFVSLGWLQLFGGVTHFSLQAPREALQAARKRSHTPERNPADEPPRSAPRLLEATAVH